MDRTGIQKSYMPPLVQAAAQVVAANMAKGGHDPAETVPAVEQKPVIGVEQVREAQLTLLEYKNGKKSLEERVIANEQWFKLRHWDYIRNTDNPDQVEPVSGWLFNSLANKHADAMDNFPVANILPREEMDKPEAEKLTAIIPVVMDHSEYEQVYSDGWDDKLRSGTKITGVFWDPDKLNGLGDISIRQMDVLNLFWEPGITDIQKSRNFFSVEMWDKKELEEMYPQLKGKQLGGAMTLSKYHEEDPGKTEDKALVVDWYYKRRVGKRRVLHYCKYVGEEILYSSENDPKFAQRGWYDHGQYPFVFDPMWKVKGSPCGFGYIDLAKGAQEYIDKMDRILQKNMNVNARTRYFVPNNANVNMEEFADLNKDLVHYEGSPEGIIAIKTLGLNGNYVTLHQHKIEELKEVTGNRDVSTGGTTSGVTAAAAIAAMQEAASKLSRDANKAAYRSFRKIVLMVVELIRQFYTASRCFRIMGEDGAEEFIRYDSLKIQRQSTGKDFGTEETFRMPLFDIEISAQKQSPYSKLSQNELAIQFYNAGFFNPQLADQAMACLEMMDFDRKQFVMAKIKQNGMLYQQLQQAQMQIAKLTAIVDRLTGSNMSGALGPAQAGAVQGQPGEPVDPGGALGAEAGESSVTKNARQRVANATAPT